jgi:hypothetical protein
MLLNRLRSHFPRHASASRDLAHCKAVEAPIVDRWQERPGGVAPALLLPHPTETQSRRYVHATVFMAGLTCPPAAQEEDTGETALTRQPFSHALPHGTLPRGW